MKELQIDENRLQHDGVTGIYIRAQGPDGKWDSYDIAQLDRDSLAEFARSRGEVSDWGMSIIWNLLGHPMLASEPDTPIYSLNITPMAINCLRRAGIDTVQLALACHMYVQYALVNRTIAANKIKPTDDVSMLADILFAMVTDDREQLDPVENRAICHLYERQTQRSPDAVGGGPDTTGVLDTLARMARDVRKWVVDDLSPSQRLHQNRDEVSRGMIVSALYRRASSIVAVSERHASCATRLVDEARKRSLKISSDSGPL